ncbi:hypothetical protein BDN70DRAFT_876097 [Pholiota conissans]|uniref:Uncharacterized protein n=1 Tax=Pholiota conissans TaxID=109636 RepID=A0A9P6D304_9AGAR|nr:hypothetical protein BDN70DRAFT_876097 [Pholiota conissans]
MDKNELGGVVQFNVAIVEVWGGSWEPVGYNKADEVRRYRSNVLRRRTASDGPSRMFSVSIAGSTPYNARYGDPNPPTYRHWYQFPISKEGTHNMAISNTSVDCAVITSDIDIPLATTLVISDNDPGFNETGKWQPS